MNWLKDRRVLTLGGMALALIAGLAVAFFLVRKPSAPSEAPPASQGGLVVQTGRDDDTKLDPMRPLRCFVGGRFVGELPLSACARRNGVATGALDVGLDPSGALAASGGGTSDITPLPPAPAPSDEVSDSTQPTAGASAQPAEPHPSAACWRYANGAWTPLSGDFTVISCAQTLFGGQCVRPGAALYGRWGDRTLRLVPGRVEVSPDNRNFRALIEQTAACPPSGAG
jgi:hypothetical protein